jgi:deoxyribodipyrimidine photo-lyase
MHAQPGILICWFRNDLRLHDQPALWHAITRCQREGRSLLPVAWHGPSAPVTTRWGIERVGPHRHAFRQQALAGLARGLQALGSGLLVQGGESPQPLADLARQVGAVALVGEALHAPEEQVEVDALRAQGLAVDLVEQGGLFDVAQLPWAPEVVPNVFTAFRQGVERLGLRPASPLPAPAALPPWPDAVPRPPLPPLVEALPIGATDERSSFPYGLPAWRGGEAVALAHLRAYLASGRPHTYKATRNALTGRDFASHWSPWLACGALSVRRVVAELRAFEAEHGASDGSYWLWFELLWREHFRWMLRRHGAALFRPQGLRPSAPRVAPDAEVFVRWREGRTGLDLVDAAMRELRHTGHLSNRLRQIVASALIHECRGDWRAGAAWFEHCLIDFDVHSNQGNWAYIAGVGTDPRGGRHFNLDKQTREHDPDGAYSRRWLGEGRSLSSSG